MTLAAIPAVQASTPAAQTEAPAQRSTVESRAAGLKAKLDALPSDMSLENETSETAPTTAAPASGTETPSAPVDEATAAEARRADRLARIAQVRQQEAETLRQRAVKKKQEQGTQEVEKLRKRLEELEPMEEAWKDPMAMFSWAEKKGLKAPDIVQALRERMTDPAALAERQALSVEQRLQAKLAEVEKKLEAIEVTRREETEQARVANDGARKAQAFVAKATSESAEYPLTAGFVERNGAEALIHLANEWVAEHLPRDYTLQQLHDHTEQILEAFQVGPRGTPNPTVTTPKNPGSAKPTVTLSNATSAGRSTIAEETPLHRLSKAERVARARAKYER